MRSFTTLCMSLLISIGSFPLLTLAQQPARRIALVIGNATYQHGGGLKNPVNDANLMAATLQQLGFDVIKKTDADLQSMQTAFKEFVNRLDDNDVALFFYAGHGMQIDGQNYLLPVDARIEDKLSVEFEAFKVSSVNRYFAYNSDKLNIMILDACRNNPYRSWMRGGGQGFMAVENQGAGTIIAFATREGETASDGSGNNGLFTEKLVQQMKVPQNITDVFQNTRVSVMDASNKQQVPQEWNMLTGNFYFTRTGGATGSSTAGNNISSTSTGGGGVETGIVASSAAARSFTDSRNNRTYRTARIGDQIWMAENLDHRTDRSFANENGDRLYTWEAALSACPDGWHLPSTREWNLLVSELGGAGIAGEALKSPGGWKDDGNGTNSSGFNALPTGHRLYIGSFHKVGRNGVFWSSTEKDKSNAWSRRLSHKNSQVTRIANFTGNAYSCRCVKD